MMSSAPLSADAVATLIDRIRERIVRFMSAASAEITPLDIARLPELVKCLSPGTVVYVAHSPSATVGDVVRTALLVQEAGFAASPHIVARRIANALTLRKALTELQDAGINRILLIAGDTSTPTGEFSNTLDILACGALEASGIRHIGVAGHPEGHKNVGPSLLWEALEAKQAFALHSGLEMHIVTQFGFDGSALRNWEHQLSRHQIWLPVHVGIAGPAPLSKLIHFAMQCGIGASLRTVMRNLSAVGSMSDLSITPEQHLLRLLETELGPKIIAPHFFAFGGTLTTARWIRKISLGDFNVDFQSGKLAMWS